MKRPAIVAMAIALMATPVAAQSGGTPPPDAARLAVAKSLAARMMPDGTFELLMRSSMDGVMRSLSNSMLDMPLRSIAKMVGEDPARIKALSPGTMRDLMAVFDPAFEQRMQIMSKVVGTELGRFMTTLEPSFRDGLAEAYAERFDLKQLNEIKAFFATPTGSAFASQLMTTQTDPAFMRRMQDVMPKMMQIMPGIMQQVAAATASLPKAKKAEDLTAADKAKIAQLMGIDPAKVQ